MDRLSGVAGHPHVAEVRGLGLMVGVELQQADGEPYPASEGMGARVVAEALERGVWVYPAGDGNVPDALLIGPPFTISDDEMAPVFGSDDAVGATDSLVNSAKHLIRWCLKANPEVEAFPIDNLP